MYNSKIQGWINYYSHYYKSEMYNIIRCIIGLTYSYPHIHIVGVPIIENCKNEIANNIYRKVKSREDIEKSKSKKKNNMELK